MNFLLDTHVLLWWLGGHVSLSKTVHRMMSDGTNLIFVSAATAWEISIKQTLGKLQAPNDLEDALRLSGFLCLPISIAHALLAERLPPHHDDPFDRLLVAQAKIEKLTLVTRDPKQILYDISTLLA